MRERLRGVGLALAILVVGMGLIVAVTEHAAGADPAEPRLLNLNDVVLELESHGVAVEPGRQPAHHPLLGIAGTRLVAGGSSVEVYVYSNVGERVDDEQEIQRHILQLHALSTDGGQPLRVTSARNLLLLYYAESTQLAASIQETARMLASVER